MADIQLRWKHSHTRDEVKRRIEPFVNKAADSFDLRFQWNGDVCNFEGQATGHIVLRDNAVEMAANLGFAASLIKSTIERTIREGLDQVLG